MYTSHRRKDLYGYTRIFSYNMSATLNEATNNNEFN